MSFTLPLSLRRNRVLRLARSVVTTLTALGVAAGAGRAQTVDPNIWVTDGEVNAIATAGNTIYIGGRFTRVGPNSGPFVGIDAGTGTLQTGWPRVDGIVTCSAPDGAGGWYIGGTFTSVDGVPRANLAHIRADKTLDAWDPGADGEPATLAVNGSTVYAGGAFLTIGGESRSYIAALDATTGLATAWNPAPNYDVFTLVVSGSTVYAGGFFTTIGGQSRNKIAALDAATGLATVWNPGSDGDNVSALAVSGSTVYAGGHFTSIGGQSRNYIAALDATTGLATAWNPGVDMYELYALAVSGSTVYVGGYFTSIGGESRTAIAALDATTGMATAWNPEADNAVRSLAVIGSTVYAAGDFSTIGGESRSNVAALDAGSGLATAWNPGAGGRVLTLAVNGSTVVVGGDFRTVGGQNRDNLAALDTTTGIATAWNPGTIGGDGSGVSALAVSGSTVYVGGSFTSTGGQIRNNIAALDAGTGLATAWNPGVDKAVLALVANGSTVYVGGKFATAGGMSRSLIAELDATTGLATAWNPQGGGTNSGSELPAGVYALAVRGSTVYAGGAFSRIGGLNRTCIAALDATGVATAWSPSLGPGASYSPHIPPDTSVIALAVSGSTVYAGGHFRTGTIDGGTALNVAALDVTTGLATGWNPGPDSYWVRSLAVNGSTVYVGGGFGTIGGESRSNIAALDAVTGLATPWNPGANNYVFALAVSGATLYVGGTFTIVGEVDAGGLAAISIQDFPVPTILVRFEAEQTSEGIQLRWQFGEPDRVVEATLQRAPNRVGPWTALALESRRTADATEALDPTVIVGETYYYRLTASLRDGTRAVFGPISASALLVAKSSGLTGIVPNPTSSSARIDFTLVRQEQVRISVVDITGREAAVLADGPIGAGSYSMFWDGRKGSTRLPAGVYYVRWISAGRAMNRKLVVMQ